jgi:hypothetical protein
MAARPFHELDPLQVRRQAALALPRGEVKLQQAENRLQQFHALPNNHPDNQRNMLGAEFGAMVDRRNALMRERQAIANGLARLRPFEAMPLKRNKNNAGAPALPDPSASKQLRGGSVIPSVLHNPIPMSAFA